MKVICIDGNVCGLTKEKEYSITNIFVRSNYNMYGLIDDYGTYNEFRTDRFLLKDELKLKFSINDFTLSINLE